MTLSRLTLSSKFLGCCIWAVLLAGCSRTPATTLGPVPTDAAGVHLLTAGRIHTADPQHPVAKAMAWNASGRLLAVGEVKDLLARYPGAQRIDAGDATVIPGLIDAHGHIMGLGLALMRANLVGTLTRMTC